MFIPKLGLLCANYSHCVSIEFYFFNKSYYKFRIWTPRLPCDLEDDVWDSLKLRNLQNTLALHNRRVFLFCQCVTSYVFWGYTFLKSLDRISNTQKVLNYNGYGNESSICLLAGTSFHKFHIHKVFDRCGSFNGF